MRSRRRRTSIESTTRSSSSSAATSRGPGLPSLKDQFVVNIDHHSTTALFGDLNWIDSTAAAVGEMIYNLAKAIGVKDHAGNRQLRLRRAADRHRIVPFLQHDRTHL